MYTRQSQVLTLALSLVVLGSILLLNAFGGGESLSLRVLKNQNHEEGKLVTFNAESLASKFEALEAPEEVALTIRNYADEDGDITLIFHKAPDGGVRWEFEWVGSAVFLTYDGENWDVIAG